MLGTAAPLWNLWLRTRGRLVSKVLVARWCCVEKIESLGGSWSFFNSEDQGSFKQMPLLVSMSIAIVMRKMVIFLWLWN